MREIIASVIVGALAVACGPSPKLSSQVLSPTASQSAVITVAQAAFFPVDLTVAAGSTVTWSNASRTLHNVVAEDGSFNSHPKCAGGFSDRSDQVAGCMLFGEVFRHTYPKPGVFPYYCVVHSFCENGKCEGMVGRITVT